jgi:hypothetical protein
MSANPKLNQKIIDYIGFSDAAMTKAAAIEAQVAAQKEAVAALIPAAVQSCIEHERIEPHQKEAFAKALTDHASAIELLTKLAAHRNTSETARLGTPTGAATKTAGYDPSRSVHSGFVGARDGRLKQSDINLFTKLGLNPPSE